MVTKVNVIAGSSTAKALVLGSALGTGLAMYQLVKVKPAWGMPATLVLAAAGTAGALYLEGAWGEVSMGIAAASMATLGSSLPGLLAPSGTGRRAGLPAQLPAGRNAGLPVGYGWEGSLPIKPGI
jgi:hypothetical protein